MLAKNITENFLIRKQNNIIKIGIKEGSEIASTNN